jgi:hypothetical protein
MARIAFGEKSVRSALSLLPLLLLTGCAGYAADYWKPKASLISPQLARFGFTGDQGSCMERQLTEKLSVWELRQLSDLAGRLVPGGANPAALGTPEFLHVAGLAEDPDVAPKTRSALEACAVPPSVVTAASPGVQGSAPATAAAGVAAATASATTPLWVNLGAARTGQGIAVDAASVTRGTGWRQAWFRLLNTDRANVGDIGYLLKIECPARTITAHAGRKYGPNGALVEEKAYPSPEGPMPIEGGTVIEVAYHALCDEPR